MRQDHIFITGCDSTTEWQLSWFIDNFKRHNSSQTLFIFDFGMKHPNQYENVVDFRDKQSGWFNKPSAMIEALKYGKRVCWLDTDIEIGGELDKIFDIVKPGKLYMVEDQPWTTRRGEKWHNTGVVAFDGSPEILGDWAKAIEKAPNVGDQEVLHSILRISPLKRLAHVGDLPNKYNVLRLQIQDNTIPNEILCMHWTGRKGNERIMEIMKSND